MFKKKVIKRFKRILCLLGHHDFMFWVGLDYFHEVRKCRVCGHEQYRESEYGPQFVETLAEKGKEPCRPPIINLRDDGER